MEKQANTIKGSSEEEWDCDSNERDSVSMPLSLESHDSILSIHKINSADNYQNPNNLENLS